MKVLLQTFWQIALLRRGPQILPASRFLLLLVIVLHWLTGVVLGLFSLPGQDALLAALGGTALMVALLHFVLMWHRRGTRLIQTLTALAGCEVILGLLAVPVTALFYSGGSMKDFAALLSLLIMGWNIAVAAHIFRHALNASQGIGFVYAIGYMMIALSVSNMITGQGGS